MDAQHIYEEIRSEVRNLQTSHISKIRLQILLYSEEAPSEQEKHFWNSFSQLLGEMLKEDQNPYSNILNDLNVLSIDCAYMKGFQKAIETRLDSEERKQAFRDLYKHKVPSEENDFLGCESVEE